VGIRVRIANGNEALVRRLGLDDPRQAPSFKRGVVVSESATSEVRRFVDEEEGGGYFLKVYRYPWHRPRRLITFTYRRSRTRTEWESLLYLRAHGLPAVQPVAYGSHRVARVVRSCYLLTKETEEAVDGDTWLSAPRARPPSQYLDGFADLIRAMHGSEFFHYDLKFRNVLILEAATGEVTFQLLDFPKGQVIPSSKPGSRRRALVWDLATLDKHAPDYFSRTERLRWFRRYRGGELDHEAREILRAVEAQRKHLLGKRK